MTAQQPRRHLAKAGAAALALVLHCAILLLAALSIHAVKPAGPAPKAVMPIALEQGPAPSTASQAAPPPIPRRRPHASRPEPPAAAATDAPIPPEQPQPALIAASPGDQARPETPQPPAAGAELPTAGEPPPLLYLAEVSRLIRLRLDDPARARLERAQGTVVVHILLARDGTVLSAEVIQGAGHPALDEEARQVVLRIHKFPELPEYYARGEQRFAIDQPIGFRGG
ncbi:MAG TPA: energy transducer TonB [Nevskia sp.]|nr:energy transducer TonB [Nevskia sp.]